MSGRRGPIGIELVVRYASRGTGTSARAELQTPQRSAGARGERGRNGRRRAAASYGVLTSDSAGEMRLARNAGIVADSRHTTTITAVQPITVYGSQMDTP